jgi:hypothetical protein
MVYKNSVLHCIVLFSSYSSQQAIILHSKMEVKGSAFKVKIDVEKHKNIIHFLSF